MTSSIIERSLSDLSSGIDERSLADVPTTDETPEQTPETFDVGAFLAGVRPTRRSVKIYPSAHLLARLDELADQIENAPDDQDVDDLIDLFEQTKSAYFSGVTFTVEKRSSDWEREFRKTTIKDLGLNKVSVDKDGNLAGPAELRAKVVLHQLAEQIVAPAGFTAAHLEALGEANEGELTKLLSLQRTVNQLIAESSEMLRRDFSQRRSGNRTTAGS